MDIRLEQLEERALLVVTASEFATGDDIAGDRQHDDRDNRRYSPARSEGRRNRRDDYLFVVDEGENDYAFRNATQNYTNDYRRRAGSLRREKQRSGLND